MEEPQAQAARPLDEVVAEAERSVLQLEGGPAVGPVLVARPLDEVVAEVERLGPELEGGQVLV